VIKAAAVVHGKFDQTTSMEYHFLDQQLAQFYLEETRQAKVFSIGSFLAIIIASLGLLGLASFLMERRLKEIGVRKILGATKASLFVRFNKIFMIQVVIAFVLSLPVSFLLMDKWLSFFAFRIELTALTFLLPGLAAMVVAFFVAGFHIMKASLTNPVNILKTE
jgi:putative ABC transport system permease protein